MRRAAVVVALLSVPISAVSAPDIREGLYEISIRAEAGGQPLTSAPMVVRQCVTQQSVQDLMTQMGGAGMCQISDVQQSANQARWKIACSGQVEASGAGEMQISGDTFNGRMDLSMNLGGQSMPMVQNFTARRVGECQ